MGTRTWNKDRATKRIDAKISALPLNDIEIKDYVRDTDLSNLPSTVAYLVDGVHLYADILNLKDMLNVTTAEGETCHKRTLLRRCQPALRCSRSRRLPIWGGTSMRGRAAQVLKSPQFYISRSSSPMT
jgi:hypothetical protein